MLRFAIHRSKEHEALDWRISIFAFHRGIRLDWSIYSQHSIAHRIGVDVSAIAAFLCSGTC